MLCVQFKFYCTYNGPGVEFNNLVVEVIDIPWYFVNIQLFYSYRRYYFS